MDHETWEQLLGRLQEALTRRSRDPGTHLRADWGGREIRLRNDANAQSEWVTFDMESEYEEQPPRVLAERMVGRALGTE